MLNVNPCAWTLDPATLYHNQPFNQGGHYALAYPLGYLPPFQLSRPSSGRIPTEFQLTRMEDGAVIDVLGQLTGAGFSIALNKDDAAGEPVDILRYPSNVALPGTWRPGLYEMRMSDGQYQWTSERFHMSDDLAGAVRLEWSHGHDLPYAGGRIDYTTRPFAYFAYLRADIAQPEYGTDRQVDTRNTREYPTRLTSFKTHRFTAIVSEFFMDAVRLAATQSAVNIAYRGRTHRAERFGFAELDWQTGGLAAVRFTFRTDAVVTAYASLSSSNETRPCYRVDQEVAFATTIAAQAVDHGLGADGMEYFLYGPDLDHLALYLVPNGGGARQAVQYDPGATYFARADNSYYLASSYDGGNIHRPVIIAVDGTILRATTFPDSVNEVWFRTSGGVFQKFSGAFSAAALSTGIELGDISEWTDAQLRTYTGHCGLISSSAIFPISYVAPPPANEGIDYWTIGSDFIVQ